VGTLQVQANFGDMGSGSLATSLNVKYLNTLTNLCIVRAARDNYQLALASASLVRTGTSAEMRIRDVVSIITTEQATETIHVF
jgi:ribonuclease P/MRP protein subunit POP5